MEEETPPPLHISRGFRIEERVPKKNKARRNASAEKRRALRANPKLKRGGAALLSNLVVCAYHKSTGLADGTGPPKNTHTVKMDGEGEREEGREGCSVHAESDLTLSPPGGAACVCGLEQVTRRGITQ